MKRRALSNLFYRDPRLLLLTIALVAVAGLSSLAVLPRTEDPELLGRNASIVTLYPGASAERVEALVTEKIEDELAEIEEIGLLTSTSSAGVSSVQIELVDEVTDTAEIWSRVRDRVDDAARSLPADAAAPEFDEAEISAWTLIVGLAWTADEPAPDAVLRRLAEALEDDLAAVSGTRDTELFGARQEEVLVEVDAERLAALGLSAGEVARSIESADAKVSAGFLRGTHDDLLIEVAGEIDTLARLRSIPVTRGADGQLVRLGDVARIAKTTVDPPTEVAFIDGRPAVQVAARMAADRRVDLWSASTRAVVAEHAEALPRGIELVTTFDQSRYTEQRLHGLARNLGLGALLVTLVVLFALGWRSALVVGLSLPLASAMVLFGMRLLGVPLHQMSVTGIIIALGLLIDNAIVIVDEVRHQRARGDGTGNAIARAVEGLAVPLLGSTLTTILAFLPLVLMPGPAGEFVGTMSVSVILALLSSLFLSLTVIPAALGYIDRTTAGAGPGFWRTGLSAGSWTERYRAFLGVLLRHPILTTAVALVPPFLGFFAGSTLDEQFFPPADRDQFQVELELPSSSALGETTRAVQVAHRVLGELPGVEASHFVAGRSAPKFYYNMIEGRENASAYGQGLVQLESPEKADEVMRAAQDRLDAALPGARVLVRQLEQGPPFEAPIELFVYGPDVDVLRDLGEEFRAELAAVPGVTHTRAGIAESRPKLLLRTDADEIERAGLTESAIAERLFGTLEGVRGGSLLESTEELPVRVRTASARRADATSIASLELAQSGAATPSWTPLSSLGELELVPQAASVPHRHSRRVNKVQGFVEAGLLPSEVLNPFRERLDAARIALPPGYHMEFGGEAAERDEAVGNLASSAAVLMVLMAATLVLSFHSFRLALLIFGVAFLSTGYGIASLFVFGHVFGFMAIVGCMGLAGIAINDTIVVLAAIRADARARAGDPSAVRDVVVRSTRHVLSTTVTTIVGFLPLLLAGGDFWPPLAVTIAGGVGGATAMALLLAPALYVLLHRRAWKRDRARAERAVGVVPMGVLPLA